MTRFRSLAIAVTALALSAGAVFAFSDLPDQALQGLGVANDHAAVDVPVRPDSLPSAADASDRSDAQLDVAADLPDAGSHGADVAAVATGDDPTPDTNHGADVSEAAKDNHGQATAAEHRPTDTGKPAEAGKPADVPPVDTSAPDGAGKPDGAGQPADPGQPTDPGAPDGAGKPDGVPPQH